MRSICSTKVGNQKACFGISAIQIGRAQVLHIASHPIATLWASIQRKPQLRFVLPLTLVALVAWLNLHPVRLRGLTVDHSVNITIGDPSFCDILPTPMSKIYIQCSNIYVEETICKINMEAESTSIISMPKKRYVNQRARWWNHNSMDAETA